MFVKCSYWHGTTLKWFLTWHLTSVYLLLTSSIKIYWAWSGNQSFIVKYWSRNNWCRESGKHRQKCREAVAPEVIGRRLPRFDRVSWKFKTITCWASCCSSFLAQSSHAGLPVTIFTNSYYLILCQSTCDMLTLQVTPLAQAMDRTFVMSLFKSRGETVSLAHAPEGANGQSK